MLYIDRNGEYSEGNSAQDKLLKMLYIHKAGRILLRPFVSRPVSVIIGKIMNSCISKILIPYAVNKYKINLNDFTKNKFSSYNDFFTRKIKLGKRKIPDGRDFLTSPCDGKLSVYSISKSSRFAVKNTFYSVKQLLKSQYLADKYEDGYIIILRLTVDDYHRFCYPADGFKSKNYYIKGKFHTVNPIANDYVSIYTENTRAYTIIRTEKFGNIVQMEIGALCVGKIVNYHEKKRISRGEEKGKFEFGGSTVILLIEKNKIDIKLSYLENTRSGYETLIKMNDIIGKKRKENLF